jgi:hypothetical protein
MRGARHEDLAEQAGKKRRVHLDQVGELGIEQVVKDPPDSRMRASQAEGPKAGEQI